MKVKFYAFLLATLSAGLPPLWGQSIITTIAGGGPASFLGDGGPATLANISAPDDIAFDSQGNLYIADANHLLVRRVDRITGIITTVAGDGTFNPGYTGDGGPATLATLNYPSGLAFDSQDNLYIADYYNNVVRKVDKITGIITTVFGTGAQGYSGDGGPASLATFTNPLRLKFDSSGDLYIADSENDVIRKIDMATGIITTIAGTGVAGYSGDGGPATLAKLSEPQGVDFDSTGNLYFTDSENSAVRKINKATGIITTIAGTGVVGYTGDGGPATLATLSAEPDGVLVGCNNNIYLTDDINNVIRMVSGSTGIITTIAGQGPPIPPGYSGDGGPPLAAKLSHPEAIIFDNQGNIILADYMYGVIRKITLVCVFTPTPTATSTYTPTSTFTWTPTFSPTPSFTPTDSPTNSPTPTESPTFTASYTPTSTPTDTFSFTPTLTLTETHSPTPTSTFTSTFTFTSTPTPTWEIRIGKQASQASAQSGDSLTYTLSVTLLGNTVDGVVLTDPLPPELTFIGMEPPPSGSATFLSSLSTIQWTLPSPLSPGTYTLSYQAQVGPLLAGGTEIVNTAQLTASGLMVPLTSTASVKISGNVTVQAGVYNEAGELVRQLFIKQFSQPIDSLTLRGGPITRLTGEDSFIDLTNDGILLGSWDGRASNGDPVSNGVYHIKIDSVDASGVVTTVTQEETVNRHLAKVSVNIYNEAGEVVKHLSSMVDDSDGTQMTDVVLNGKVLRPGISGSTSEIQMTVQTSGAPMTLSWDGTSDSGAVVTNGQYFLMVHWADGTEGTSDITREVLVAGGQDASLDKITAMPNVLRTTSGQSLVTFKSPSPGLTLKVSIYDLAGERVGFFQGASGSGQAVWNAVQAASGMYLGLAEEISPDGGVKYRQILKILVIH